MRIRAITDKFLGLAMTLIIVASFLWIIWSGENFAGGYHENTPEEVDVSLVREAVDLYATDTIFRIENNLWSDRFLSTDDVFYRLHKFGGGEDSEYKLLVDTIRMFFKLLFESKATLISGAISFFLLQCLVFKKGTVAKNTASTITFALFVGGLLYGLAG